MACRIVFFHICPYPSESTHWALFWEDDFCIPKNCRSTVKIGWHQKPAARAARVIAWFFSMGPAVASTDLLAWETLSKPEDNSQRFIETEAASELPEWMQSAIREGAWVDIAANVVLSASWEWSGVEQKAQVCQQCVRGPATRNDAFFRASDAYRLQRGFWSGAWIFLTSSLGRCFSPCCSSGWSLEQFREGAQEGWVVAGQS